MAEQAIFSGNITHVRLFDIELSIEDITLIVRYDDGETLSAKEHERVLWLLSHCKPTPGGES